MNKKWQPLTFYIILDLKDLSPIKITPSNNNPDLFFLPNPTTVHTMLFKDHRRVVMGENNQQSTSIQYPVPEFELTTSWLLTFWLNHWTTPTIRMFTDVSMWQPWFACIPSTSDSPLESQGCSSQSASLTLVRASGHSLQPSGFLNQQNCKIQNPFFTSQTHWLWITHH